MIISLQASRIFKKSIKLANFTKILMEKDKTGIFNILESIYAHEIKENQDRISLLLSTKEPENIKIAFYLLAINFPEELEREKKVASEMLFKTFQDTLHLSSVKQSDESYEVLNKYQNWATNFFWFRVKVGWVSGNTKQVWKIFVADFR